ncbi:hypothetical protein [Streptomyces sp. NPDC003730]
MRGGPGWVRAREDAWPSAAGCRCAPYQGDDRAQGQNQGYDEQYRF